MKNKISLRLLIPFLLIPAFLFAQVPQGIPYQAMIRNSDGSALMNTNVTVRFTLHQNTTTGAVEYQETQALVTNAFGLINAVFGQGIAVQGTFAAINWSNATKFIQVEANDGNGYVDMGTQQMMSVPFAMYAAQSGSSNTNSNTSFFTFESANQYSGSANSANSTTITTLNLQANQAVKIEGTVSRIGNTCNCNDGTPGISLNVISGQIANVINSGIGGQTNCSTDVVSNKGFIIFKAVVPTTVDVVFFNSGSIPSCTGTYNVVIIK